MTFQEQYTAATSAFDSQEYSEAVRLYVDLLKSDNDRIKDLAFRKNKAWQVHVTMAMTYALHEIFAQRAQQLSQIRLDLGNFSFKRQFHICYDSETSEFLRNWKDDSWAFKNDLSIAQRVHDSLNRDYRHKATPQQVEPVDAYAAIWVVTDLLDFERILPDDISGYANLGCGCGLFDCAFLQTYSSNTSAVLIDIDKNACNSSMHLAKLNGLTNTTSTEYWPIGVNAPNLIVSIRSCGFIYDVSEYDNLFKSLAQGSRVFLDLAPSKEEKTLSYFAQLGAQTVSHNRTNTMQKLYEFQLLD